MVILYVSNRNTNTKRSRRGKLRRVRVQGATVSGLFGNTL